MNTWIIILIIVLGLLVVLIGRFQLKSDNAFFYKSGRSMRPLDIFLAFDRNKFDKRINNLDDSTRLGFTKWLGRDVLLGAVVHGFIGLLSLACSYAYQEEFLRETFIILAWAQLLSFMFHVMADVIMYRSVRKNRLDAPMGLYNAMVLLKLVIPLLGFFMSATTGILLWFQFLVRWEVQLSSVIFLLPLFAITILLMIRMTSDKKTPLQ